MTGPGCQSAAPDCFCAQSLLRGQMAQRWAGVRQPCLPFSLGLTRPLGRVVYCWVELPVSWLPSLMTTLHLSRIFKFR